MDGSIWVSVVRLRHGFLGPQRASYAGIGNRLPRAWVCT